MEDFSSVKHVPSMSQHRQRVATAVRAVRIMHEVIASKRKLQPTWERECIRANLEPQSRSLLRDICSGSLRWLDYYHRLIDYAGPAHIVDDLELRLLTVSTLYQSENMARAPDHSTLQRTAADGAAHIGKKHTAGALQAVCQRVLEMSVEQRQNASTNASSYSLPSWLYNTLLRDVHCTRWLEASGHLLLERPHFLNVCVPPRAVYGGASEYASMLQREHELPAELGLAPHGVLIRTRPRTVESLPGITTKVVHVQDAVQQYGCSLLRPVGEDETILDACAAPGGKSRTLLSHHEHAQIVAVESNAKKVASMRAELLGHGAPSSTDADDGGLAAGRRKRLRILNADVDDVMTWWDGKPFSAIVLDPPCTATGLLRTLPEIKAHRAEEDVAVLRRMQLQLLKRVWTLLRPGGELLYTTCSILKSENDVVIDTFLKRTADACAGAVPLPDRPATNLDGSGRTAQVCVRRRKHGALLFLPSESHQGGYVALLRKRESTDAAP